MKSITPCRPYLVRAYYEWLMDNDLTPHVVVDATYPNTQVPVQFVQNGQIVLNITDTAVNGLIIGNEHVEFNARFGGVPQQVVLPMASIIAIYARENDAGTVFNAEEAYLADDNVESEEEPSSTPDNEPPKKRSHLTVVK